jgi:hypothetical protein
MATLRARDPFGFTLGMLATPTATATLEPPAPLALPEELALREALALPARLAVLSSAGAARRARSSVNAMKARV